MQREARYEAIVQILLDREVEERDARERRQLGYRQYVENGSVSGTSGSTAAPIRQSTFRTKVPCRVTPAAHALLAQIRKQFSGSSITFRHISSRQQAVLATGSTGTVLKQIGVVEQCVETDPQLCDVRHHGLEVDTDGGTMLVFRFRYPATAVRISALASAADEAVSQQFSELRPALELRPADEQASPGLVWVTRPEIEMLDEVGSRDFEAFYVRFKLEVQAGVWHTLSNLLSSFPNAQSYRGSYYLVLREPDGTNGRIYQRTVDDSGNAVDIGLDRTYDAATATDILLLYLGGDILADFADIYFTLHSLDTAAANLLKEEFFAVVRHFWANTASLVSCYGNELAAIIRMSLRAVPTPAQALLLKADWINVRQLLVDRFGEGGRKASDLTGQEIDRSRNASVAWPFATFPAGEVNVGLRLVYHQDGEQLGAHTGMRALGATTELDYALVTRPAELQNVVMVAEQLPAPTEIDHSWVKQHDWILADVLLDESFRDALNSIRQEARADDSSVALDAERARLLEHLRANILHYQRAIWQQEDPQQRSMRYRKSGKKVPLEWRFELESGGALTIDALGERLSAPSVDGLFAAYSTGRQADLDQVIDPAGPLGYYGNYAIYQMRPEFGSADLFSMLHFFKSPFLRVDPETGAADVARTLNASDAGMSPLTLEYAALELLSAHGHQAVEWTILTAERELLPSKLVHGGTPPDQMILACAENAHCISMPGAAETQAPLLVPCDDLLTGAAAAADADAAWAILARGAEAHIQLVTTGSAVEPPSIVARQPGESTPRLLARGGAASAQDATADPVIIARADQTLPRLRAGAGAPPIYVAAPEWLIVAPDEAALRPSMVTG